MIKKFVWICLVQLFITGYIRLLKKASKYGKVVVALTSDLEIKKYKKIEPELNFRQRKEILESIKYVNKVIKSGFFITNNFLKKISWIFLFMEVITQIILISVN